MLSLLVIILLSYLVGSIPTGLLVARARGINIREHGSGNLGATNVFRVLGPLPGLAVLVIDLLKGVVAVGLIAQIRIAGEATPAIFGAYGSGWMMVVAGGAAVLGHIFTAYAGFRGGKGVATGTGVAVALAPVPVLVGAALFGLVVLLTRYVSLASLVAAASLPLTQLVRQWIFGISVPAPMMWFTVVVPVLILITHHRNIQRLLAGREHRIRAGTA